MSYDDKRDQIIDPFDERCSIEVREYSNCNILVLDTPPKDMIKNYYPNQHSSQQQHKNKPKDRKQPIIINNYENCTFEGGQQFQQQDQPRLTNGNQRKQEGWDSRYKYLGN